MQRWLRIVGRHLGSSIFNKTFVVDNLHIIILTNFAVAQPLYEVLATFTDFFVAQRTTPSELTVLVIYLSLVLPFQFLVSLELIVGLLGRFPRKVVHGLLVMGLTATIALPLLKKIPITSEAPLFFFFTLTFNL